MASRPCKRGGHGGPFSAGIDWGRLWSTARIELGLSDDEFWRLTPYELDLLVQAQRRKQRTATIPVAMLIQVLCNVHRDSQQRLQPFTLDEVLGWMGIPPEPEPPTPPATPEELRAKLQQAATMFSRQNGQEA